MALLTPGYWPSTYFSSGYWADDYWPDYGVFVVLFEGADLLLGSSKITSGINEISKITSGINKGSML